MNRSLGLTERFKSNVEFSTDGCWLWIGDMDGKGYGRLSISGRRRGAHRISWELAHGPIPEGQCVLHKCDVPICVRPDHLFLGTKADNTRDMIAKGRAVNPVKVSDDDVRRIRSRRAAGELCSDIAPDYGITASQVSNIVARRSRAHV